MTHEEQLEAVKRLNSILRRLGASGEFHLAGQWVDYHNGDRPTVAYPTYELATILEQHERRLVEHALAEMQTPEQKAFDLIQRAVMYMGVPAMHLAAADLREAADIISPQGGAS